MKTTAFLLCLIPFICLISCRKDGTEAACTLDQSGLKTTDTIRPSAYLMYYPGSWWSYSNGTTETVDNWEEVTINVKEFEGTCSLYKVVLPSTHNGLIYDSKYCVIPSVFEYTEFEPLLDTVQGIFYEEVTTGSGSTTTITKTCEGFISSLTVSGSTYQNVLHIKKLEEIFFGHISGGPTFSYHYYYAPNVGLIRKISNTSSHDTLDLVDHYIAPH